MVQWCNSSFPKFCRDMLLLLLFLIISPSVLCDYRWSLCNNASTFQDGSAYSTNLDGVLDDLSRNALQSSGFNTSSRGQSPNKAYGLLQCIGNVSAARCSNCSVQATNIGNELCGNHIGARVWMHDCFMRYDNSNFISNLDTNFFLLENTQTVTSNLQSFMSTTSDLLSKLSDQAYIAANKLLGTGSESYSASGKVYGLAQCWRDLSVKDCRSCLFQARQDLQQCCSTRQGANAMSGSCTVRYEIYPFLESHQNLSPSPPSPSTLIDTHFETLVDPSYAITIDPIVSKGITFPFLSDLINQACLPNSASFDLGRRQYYSGEVIGQVMRSTDMSVEDCRKCLTQAMKSLESCCYTNQVAQARSGSCTLSYHINPSLDSPTAPPPQTLVFITKSPGHETPPVRSRKSSGRLGIILGITVGSIVIFAGCSMAILGKLKFALSRKPVNLVEENEDVLERRLFRKEQISFSLEVLVEATEDFNDNNKLGEGGFGPVYKGMTRDGKQIAVKKLSARSAQGRREFMNEVELVANIQHRNLVNLLGCCTEKTERLLVYEYLPNKSLDTFLFDPLKRTTLDWHKRFNIIIGIARGLLYLHEDSQLRIIHRDIKANNILLDEKLNPKIADFGLARLFSDNETEIQSRVAGTYGYMAPEYAMGGQLSVKVDVYSFGVVLLEIVSGRRNTDMNFSKEKQNLTLLERAWRLFKEEHALKILDVALVGKCLEEQVIRCIHIGLLCTQADPEVRPTMSTVVTMITTSSVPLPDPTRPAYVSMGGQSTNVSIIPATSSLNETTMSHMEPR